MKDLEYEMLRNSLARDITQNSDLGHNDILDIAKLCIYYCLGNLREDININGNKQYINNCNDLENILVMLCNNIEKHDKIKNFHLK